MLKKKIYSISMLTSLLLPSSVYALEPSLKPTKTERKTKVIAQNTPNKRPVENTSFDPSFTRSEDIPHFRSSHIWGFKVSSGWAQFPDLQVPESILASGGSDSPFSEGRADGTVVETPNTRHTGMPIDLNVRYIWKKNAPYQLIGEFDFLHIANTRGAPDTSDSSYMRTGLSTKIERTYHEFAWHPSWRAGLIARRSRYLKISTGHFNDAMLPQLEGGISTRPDNWLIKGSYAQSIWASFKYYPGNFGSAAVVKNAKSSESEWGIEYDYRMFEATWLNLGYQNQVVQVHIPEVIAYESFGLLVNPFSVPAKNYTLSTQFLSLGISKFF